MFHIRHKKDALYALIVLLLFMIPALLSWNSKTQLGAIIESGSLKLVTRYSPNTYYLERDEEAGFEYELVKAYSDHLGVKLELVLPTSFSGIFSTMEQKNGHIAAAMLTVTEERKAEFDFTLPYLHTATALIYRTTQGVKSAKDIPALIKSNKEPWVIANSSHAELLKNIKTTNPDLRWHETTEHSSTDLLEMLQRKEIDYTIVDSVTFDAQKSFFPGLKKAFDLEEPQPLAWMLTPHRDKSLLESLNRFLSLNSTKDLIHQLKEKYFNRHNPLNFYDTLTFKKDVETRLPKLEQYFLMAEQETDLDWQLLAAVAYQESHWKPDAVSPTGVKGIMMLTNAAAKEVGVSDRTDPQQSIIGGARYLTSVLNKIPERITGPDRMWLALAGYNVGFGHLEDARVLTHRAGKNRDKWEDIRQFLPLLTKEKYFNTVRYGYARGYEPVKYVSNIKKYIELISWEMQLLQARRKDEEADLDPDHESWDDTVVKENILPAL